jgi:site-specific DNA-methyltransferase (adenine-specific)
MARIYYEDESVTLWHGDCRDVLPGLADASIDLVLTDPPYGTTALKWDKAPDLAWMWAELNRVSRPAAVQAVCSQQPFATDLIASNRARYWYELIWQKTMAVGFLDANRRPLRAHENIQIFCDAPNSSTYNPQKTPIAPTRDHRIRRDASEAAHYRKQGRQYNTAEKTDRYPLSVQLFANGNGVRTGDHPTAKPQDMIEWLIASYSNAGNVVLDIYGGRGTTAWAAKRLGRRCIIVEAEAKYCAIAARGLSQDVMNLEAVA